MANAGALKRPFVRYFCTLTTKESPHQDSWGDVGWDYFVAIQEHFRVRVFPNGVLHQAHISEAESRWGAYAGSFNALVTSPWINVVCGSKEDLARYWTQSNDTLLNVAITTLNGSFGGGLYNRAQRQWAAHMEHARDKYGVVDEGDHGIYRRYDLVACLTQEDAVALKASDVVATHLQPGECAAALLNLTTKGPSDAAS